MNANEGNMKRIEFNQDLEIGDELGYELWYELRKELYWDLELPIREITTC